jgi:hypothetical protein
VQLHFVSGTKFYNKNICHIVICMHGLPQAWLFTQIPQALVSGKKNIVSRYIFFTRNKCLCQIHQNIP